MATEALADMATEALADMATEALALTNSQGIYAHV